MPGTMHPKYNRTWFKCNDCNCTWYDDANNSFNGCPECEGTFEIIENEIIKDK